MSKVAAFGLLACCAVLARAQTVRSQDNNMQSNATQLTIRGCVSGGQRYTFMQASTGAIFELTGDPSKFAAAQGKLSEITAREVPPEPKSSELPKLEVTNLQVVAEQCPIQPAPRARSATPNSSNPPSPVPQSPATRPYAPPGGANQTAPAVNNPNISGAKGTPSPGTGNTQSQQPPPPPQ